MAATLVKTFVVIPCFNEQEHLAATCQSLALCNPRSFPVHLVLVDNASTDATASVMADIKNILGINKVTIVCEPVRGYVPARHAGAVAVTELVKQDGLLPEQVLVLQADADTIYLSGYIDAMHAACSGKPGDLLEGVAITGREFAAQFRQFDKLSRSIDFALEPWMAAEEAQVIVDDKVCAYLLSDYWDWGGHTREVDHQGREVHAETTRLFINGKRDRSAVHKKVDAACAVPSRRKLLIQGPAYFASAGFPRDVEWVKSWVSQPRASHEFLASPYDWPLIREAIRSRQRHLLALFMILPVMCANDTAVAPDFQTFASGLCRTGTRAAGSLLGTALSVADDRGGFLGKFLDRNFPLSDPLIR